MGKFKEIDIEEKETRAVVNIYLCIMLIISLFFNIIMYKQYMHCAEEYRKANVLVQEFLEEERQMICPYRKSIHFIETTEEQENKTVHTYREDYVYETCLKQECRSLA